MFLTFVYVYRVDIIDDGMERFQYIILKVKRLLEEAQKHKENASKETTKLNENMSNNRVETEVFKEKGKPPNKNGFLFIVSYRQAYDTKCS